MKKLYDISVNILAVIAVALAILDLAKELTKVQLYVDTIIYIAFVIDYIDRICNALKSLKDKS